MKSGTNILVTGGAGYIGSHVCKALSLRGFNPITLDNLVTGWKDAVKFGPLEEVDLLNREAIDKVFEKYQPTAVLHFAALSQVGESFKCPGKYWKNNVIGSLNLVQACIAYNCKNFIFSSTCAVYGNHDGTILTEGTPQTPENAYGASKRSVEEIIKNFASSDGLKYVIFRYFNVAGADADAEIGEFHLPETHLIPLVLKTIDGSEREITIFGTDYKTPDGTCIRDFVHVSDLAEAHILGLDWIKNGGQDRVYNLGTGEGFSVKEVIKVAQKITGKKIPVLEGGRRSGDCEKLVSASDLAKSELLWSPKRSSLEIMIADAWRWHSKCHYKI